MLRNPCCRRLALRNCYITGNGRGIQKPCNVYEDFQRFRAPGVYPYPPPFLRGIHSSLVSLDSSGKGSTTKSSQSSGAEKTNATKEQKDTSVKDPNASKTHGPKVLPRILMRSGTRPSLPKPMDIAARAYGLSKKLALKLVAAVRKIVIGTWHVLKMATTDPAKFKLWLKEIWGHIKEEMHHYKLGFKLFWSDLKTAAGLSRRVLAGNQLSRRERKQLVRTTGDIFRLVPFSFFLIVPFMEFFLPVAIKLFPNMLPSQFQTSLKKEEDQKKVLQSRIELARFLQDTATEMGQKIASKSEDDEQVASAKDLLKMIEDVRNGRQVDNNKIVQCAKLFKDEVTLDNVSRAQLVALAKYMGLNPYGTDALLRFQLRNKIRSIKADDKHIIWEGVSNLSRDELKAACEERGMRATGLSEEDYRRQLEQWLELSVNKNIPASLLILSRAFTITQEPSEEALQESISSLEKDVLNEAVLESAKESETEDSRTLRQIRLDSIEHQNELIEMERQAFEAAEEARRLAKDAETRQQELAELRERIFRGEATEQDLRESAQEAEKAAQAAADAQAAAQKQYLLVRHEQEEEERPSSKESGLAELLEQGPILDPSRAAELGKEHGLTSDAIKALEVLASESSVLRERALLARVKATRLQMDARDMLARGRIGKKAAASVEESESGQEEATDTDVPTSRVKKSLDRMLSVLEEDLANVDTSIGDKLHVLDKDKDGVLTAEELHDAIKSILRNNDTDEAAAEVVKMLDTDKDGFITKDEIVKFSQALEAAEAETRLRDKEEDEPLAATPSHSSESDSEYSDKEGKTTKMKSPVSTSQH
eukprot:gb/GECG01016796.1/.p1 GENE.gb/GECG01016796.1/~~gb/GECG01016796.1/.p1  ORF type:complete len:824 (+),score=150.64 gb/GECG01016796.1/:1-2472(+)